MKEITVCYASLEDKARRYPLVTIPAIIGAFDELTNLDDPKQFGKTVELFDAWLYSDHLELRTEPRLKYGDADTLARLHELMRSGTYFYNEDEPCDGIQSPATTIEEGGDCDQWALVGAVAVWLLGFPVAYLVGVGTAEDKYLHIYLMVGGFDADDNFTYWALDPKGDQPGVDFDYRPDGEWIHTPHLVYEDEDRPAGRIMGGAERMA